jgi:hypothetical protein
MPTVIFREPQAKLVQVRDERFGDTFDPPMVHLGNPLQDGSILEVAALALTYHANLISDAHEFINEQQP